MEFTADDGSQPADSLSAFQRGDPEAMERLYMEHFGTVRRAVASVVPGADGDTVIHEVFYRLLSNEALRRSYDSGSFAGWLHTVARNCAIDYARRRGREVPYGLVPESRAEDATLERRVQARVLLRAFCDTLPAEWLPVFDARFVRQLDQRRAARVLGIARTTLAYRESRIRARLRSFLQEGKLA